MTGLFLCFLYPFSGRLIARRNDEAISHTTRPQTLISLCKDWFVTNDVPI